MIKRINQGISITFFLVGLLASPAFAQTIWTDATSDWFVSGNWSAGVPNAGTDAEINNGGTAQISAAGAAARDMTLGLGALDSGTLSVSGAGTLSAGNNLVVGSSGTGTLNITNGGVAGSGFVIIGDATDSSGTVIVDGAGSTLGAFSLLSVGASGTGTLKIINGGAAFDAFAEIAGTVTVDGAGSTWTSNFLDVGGTGTLKITNGGAVSLFGAGGRAVR
jgi:T5SS/PEP-CTERM-associated repeat protein